MLLYQASGDCETMVLICGQSSTAELRIACYMRIMYLLVM